MPSAATITKRVKKLGGFKGRGHRRAALEMKQLIEDEQLDVGEFSIRDMFEAMVPNGANIVRAMDPMNHKTQIDLMENVEAWDSTAFSYLTSRLVFTKMREQYQNPEFVFTNRVQTLSSRLRVERFPGLSTPFEQFADPVEEKMPFPQIGINDDQVESNKTEKRGGVLGITKEAIFFDRTAMLLQRAGQIGFNLGLRKEMRIADTVYGLTSAPNQGQNYIYNGTSYALYQTATPWINQLASNDLVTWDNINLALMLFYKMTDPITGTYISLSPKEIVCMPQRMYNAKAMMTATSVANMPYGGTSGTTRGIMTISPTPIGNFEVVSSIQAYGQLVLSGIAAANAAATWILGDLGRAFGYVENFPLTVVQAANNTQAEFDRDIVAQFKASEMGIPVVLDPRAVVYCPG